MTPFDSLLLGIVEGITEFLPISSTGHLVLTSTLLHITQTDFVKTFEIVIQLGAILSVIVIYFKKFFDLELMKRLIVAFIPTGIIGLLLYHIVKTYLLGNDYIVLAALFFGGIAIIAFEYWHKDTESDAGVTAISYPQAALVGVAQSFAIIPGVSRSAATILGGLSLGLSRETIVEFSFLLAVPTMLAASGLDLVKNGVAFTNSDWILLAIGFVTSFIVAMAAIKWLLGYVRHHSFIAFGVYRIVLAVVFYLVFIH